MSSSKTSNVNWAPEAHMYGAIDQDDATDDDDNDDGDAFSPFGPFTENGVPLDHPLSFETPPCDDLIPWCARVRRRLLDRTIGHWGNAGTHRETTWICCALCRGQVQLLSLQFFRATWRSRTRGIQRRLLLQVDSLPALGGSDPDCLVRRLLFPAEYIGYLWQTLAANDIHLRRPPTDPPPDAGPFMQAWRTAHPAAAGGFYGADEWIGLTVRNNSDPDVPWQNEVEEFRAGELPLYPHNLALRGVHEALLTGGILLL